MRSALTQRVIRQLTYQALYADTVCFSRPVQSQASFWRTDGASSVSHHQTRALFGFSFKPRRRPKPKNFTPGLEIMLKLNEMLRLEERTPPLDELAEAFVALFKSQQKLDGGYTQLEDAQIETAISTFEYVQKNRDSQKGFGIATEDLRMAMRILERGSSDAHKKMATLIFDELEMMRKSLKSDFQEEDHLSLNLVPYIAVLCQCDGALIARDLVEKYWESNLKDAKILKQNGTREKIVEPIGSMLWMRIFQGLIRERLNDEVEKTIDVMQNHGVPFDSKLHHVVVDFYARLQSNIEMMKKWYEHPIAGSGQPTNATDSTVLQVCIVAGEMEWGEPILAKLVERNPQDRASWNTIFQWAAAKGRGVDEIEHMMKVMEKRNAGKPKLQPGMDTINALIELANVKEDPYTAERYFALGEKWGFQPDALTHLLQLDYRINVKDLSGAMIAYRRLQGEDLSNNEDLPYTNRLIVAFCEQAELRHDTIISLVEDLTERKAPFYPETVSALCLLHLQRDEMMDLADLLNTYAVHYSRTQRSTLHDLLLARAIDSRTTEDQCWQLYENLLSVFPELMTVDDRSKFMVSFMERDRPDMALSVFRHMQKSRDKTRRPTINVYYRAITGLSQHGNVDAIQSLHNSLRIDAEIEPNTHLNNALMLAYLAVDEDAFAMDVWQDVAHSREGPDITSLLLIFRICEQAYKGEETARELWAKLKRSNIAITREVFAGYIGALAGNSQFDDCVNLLANAKAECGLPADALMIGTFHNATPADPPESRQQVKEFIRDTYPVVYEDLLRYGMQTLKHHDPDYEEGYTVDIYDESDPGILSKEVLFNTGPLGRDIIPGRPSAVPENPASWRNATAGLKKETPF